MLLKVLAAGTAALGLLAAAFVISSKPPDAQASAGDQIGCASDVASIGDTEIDGYRGEQLQNAAAIINAAVSLGIRVHGQEIGVMTAMDESALRDVDHGDAAGPDSRGLFQQRTSWGTLAERMDPSESATLFFRRMLQLPDWQTRAPTDVAHSVQVNKDPNVYARYWAPAQDVVTSLKHAQGCAETARGDLAAGDPGPGASGGGGFAPDSTEVEKAISFAEAQIGKPYIIDGMGNPGWDCSGLTLAAYETAGVTIGSHSVSAQYATMAAEGRLLPYAAAERGDLLFWRNPTGSYTHVAIYLGEGMMIAAPQLGENVKIQKLWTSTEEALQGAVARPTGSK